MNYVGWKCCPELNWGKIFVNLSKEHKVWKYKSEQIKKKRKKINYPQNSACVTFCLSTLGSNNILLPIKTRMIDNFTG